MIVKNLSKLLEKIELIEGKKMKIVNETLKETLCVYNTGKGKYVKIKMIYVDGGMYGEKTKFCLDLEQAKEFMEILKIVMEKAEEKSKEPTCEDDDD